MGSLPFSYCFSSFILFASMNLLLAADNITQEVSIQDGETLISSAQRFELGFFSPGNSTKRYLGIWYKKSPETIVWVANRNNPILDSSGVLTISENGNLVLLSKAKNIVWSSNISVKVENTVARLLDTGNFVLMDASENYRWQSFDYPSDIQLPGMKLGWNLKTGLERYLTSWKTADDPSSGDFTFRFNINYLLPELVIYRGSTKIARSGPWNGVYFGGIPTNPNLIFEMILVHNEAEFSYWYQPFNDPLVMLVKLTQSGMKQWQIWNERSNKWDLVYSAPEDVCGNYGHCGANSVCSINKTPICECLNGFESKSKFNQTSSQGCVRKLPLDCEEGDGFIKVDNVKVPDLVDVSLNESMSLKECEAKCLSNCSCKAYTDFNAPGDVSGCLMWFGDLIDIRKLVENKGTQDFYLRVPASELKTNSSNGTSMDTEDKKNKGNRKLLWMIVAPILSLAVVTLGFLIHHVRRKHRRKVEDLLLFDMHLGQKSGLELTEEKKLGKNCGKEVKLPLFSFASVCAATDNFSATNKLGEGGFGTVYKGTLLKGDQIAVKRLSRTSGQGWEELKNEAMLIAKLQHKNLVRLLGCCIEQDEKILIYEYMPNKSLDFFLFDPSKRKLLDWKTRIQIIEGIAQGLLYLHEFSTIRIIHRDLKVSNILLDRDMNPKISDFGIARIFQENELQANTRRIVGTYGYMSPEYALEGILSTKSDVFSFGVLLLEIVSGKKSTGFYQTESPNLLGYAWNMWTSDKGSKLLDPELEDQSSMILLPRYVNIGLLCVQESAKDRPSMAEVASMLMNQAAILPSPKQPAFSYVRNSRSVNSYSGKSEKCSVNNVTLTTLEAR